MTARTVKWALIVIVVLIAVSYALSNALVPRKPEGSPQTMLAGVPVQAEAVAKAS